MTNLCGLTGFMMSSFEVGECEAIKAEDGVEGGVGGGVGGPAFGALDDPPLAALHHLHQVKTSPLHRPTPVTTSHQMSPNALLRLVYTSVEMVP